MCTRTRVTGVLFLAIAMLAGCDDQRATGPDHANPEGASLARVLQNGEFEDPCDEVMTVALRNAIGEAVGEVRVWNGETTAYVRLTAEAGWEFTEVRVGGALQPNQFPRTGGVVDPSRFQFGGAVMPASNEVVIEALHLGNPYGVELGDEVLLSIFARLRPVDGGSTVDAWAEGTAFRTGEHPMYFRYTVRECEGEPPQPRCVAFDAGSWSADWEDAVVPGVTFGTMLSYLVEERSGGGNPGAFRYVSMTMGQNSQIWVQHRRLGAVWNPAEDGPVDRIRGELDASAIPPTASAIVSFLLVQNGTVYWSERFFANGPGWFSTGWTESDFVRFGTGPGPERPDFSVNGAPIQFGYLTGGSHTTGAPTATRQVGVDNWRVQVCTGSP
ncbi:hypothetical protein BH23GEM7_BH23GEM7_08270 [soil metagenome]|nr:hypothetical protein [Gemmatimonadota bacterium]